MLPIELNAVVLIILEAAKFRDEIEFELGSEPRNEGDVLADIRQNLKICTEELTSKQRESFGSIPISCNPFCEFCSMMRLAPLAGSPSGVFLRSTPILSKTSSNAGFELKTQSHAVGDRS